MGYKKQVKRKLISKHGISARPVRGAEAVVGEIFLWSSSGDGAMADAD